MPTANHHIVATFVTTGVRWCVACNQPLEARWADQQLCPASRRTAAR